MTERSLAILAIEDDPGDAEILKRHLEDIPGWEVTLDVISDGPIVESLKESNPDIAFLDYLLGAQTGLEILSEIRDSGDERPVILMTGHGDEHVAAEAFHAGADDYLVKGEFSPDALRRTIDSILEKQRLQHEKAVLEEELRQFRTMEAVSTLAGGIAHDFNNMLTGMMGFLDLALLRSADQEVNQNLKKVQSVCNRMDELIQHLLNFDRTHSATSQKVNLRKLVQELDVILSHIVSNEIDLEIDYPNESLVVLGSGSRITQTLFGLCMNGVEAMPDGGRLSLRIDRFKCELNGKAANPALKEGAYFVISVTDTGIGMDPETRERIFEPFFTTKTLDQKKGTGLGLSIAWETVRKLGGAIEIESQPGKGSTFRVYLPDRLGYQPPESEATEKKNETKTALFVDDEELVLQVGTAILERLGYRVLPVGTGEEAIAVFREAQNSIQLIVLDMNLPGMSGEECLNQILAIKPMTPVLFSSGQFMEGEAERLIQMGAMDVIQKPFLIKDLSEKLMSLEQRSLTLC